MIGDTLDVEVTPDDITVECGVEVQVAVRVRNSGPVVDAFEVMLLGAGESEVLAEPGLLSLFEDDVGEARLTFVLPTGFEAGTSNLWVKVSSITDPAMQALRPLKVTVEPQPAITLEIDPEALRGGRKGHFALTIHNTGNSEASLVLDGDDKENHFSFDFETDRDRLVLPPATTKSVQAVVTGRRAITGTTIPRAFTIRARAPGLDAKVEGTTFAQRPYVPGPALLFAGVIALLGLWAVIVGIAIDAVIDDTDADTAQSLEEGLEAVVDDLRAPTEDDAATAAQDRIKEGVNVPTADSESDGDPAGFLRLAQDGADDGDVIDAPEDAIVGTVFTAADASIDRPIPGTIVTIQGLLEDEPLRGERDPNIEPIELVADKTGSFQRFEMVPGLYAVSFESPGYVDVECRDVEIPAAQPVLAGCTIDGTPIVIGNASRVEMIGEASSIAGIVTFEGVPQPGATVSLSRLDSVTGEATVVPDPQAADAEGRFAFVLPPSLTDPQTPGAFEILVEQDEFSPSRMVLELGGGENIIGLDVALSPVTPTTTTTTTTTTLPPDERILFGLVRDAATGAPLPNANVRISGAENTFDVSSLADGTYRQDALTVGIYNLTFTAPGYDPAAATVTVPQTADLTVSLQPSRAELTGRVTGQAALDGQPTMLTAFAVGTVPVAGAEVRVGGELFATTDEQGVWTSTTTLLAGEARVDVAAPGYLPGSTTVVIVPEPQGAFEIGEIVLLPLDSWNVPIGTEVSASLLDVELLCGPGPTWTPADGSVAITSVTWTPLPGRTAPAPPGLAASIVRTADGRTAVALVDVPREGRLRLDMRANVASLYQAGITIPDLRNPPSRLVLPFTGPGGVVDSVGEPVPGSTAGGACPSIAAGAPVAPEGRSFVVRSDEFGRSTYLATGLPVGETVTVTAGGTDFVAPPGLDVDRPLAIVRPPAPPPPAPVV